MPKTKVYRKAEMRRISRIAAHVPDLVVYSDFRKIPYVEHFNGVLLFADVSGRLCGQNYRQSDSEQPQCYP